MKTTFLFIVNLFIASVMFVACSDSNKASTPEVSTESITAQPMQETNFTEPVRINLDSLARIDSANFYNFTTYVGKLGMTAKLLEEDTTVPFVEVSSEYNTKVLDFKIGKNSYSFQSSIVNYWYQPGIRIGCHDGTNRFVWDLNELGNPEDIHCYVNDTLALLHDNAKIVGEGAGEGTGVAVEMNQKDIALYNEKIKKVSYYHQQCIRYMFNKYKL